MLERKSNTAEKAVTLATCQVEKKRCERRIVAGNCRRIFGSQYQMKCGKLLFLVIVSYSTKRPLFMFQLQRKRIHTQIVYESRSTSLIYYLTQGRRILSYHNHDDLCFTFVHDNVPYHYNFHMEDKSKSPIQNCQRNR